MTRYNDELSGGDDFDDQVKGATIEGYREGVGRVLEYVEAIHASPKLVAELKWAIDEGII